MVCCTHHRSSQKQQMDRSKKLLFSAIKYTQLSSIPASPACISFHIYTVEPILYQILFYNNKITNHTVGGFNFILFETLTFSKNFEMLAKNANPYSKL